MKRTVITGLMCLGIGFALGFYANEQLALYEAAMSSGAAIVHDMATLQCLTNGDPQQAETILESHMTIQGMLLEGILKELPQRLRNKNLVRIADRMRDQQEEALTNGSPLSRSEIDRTIKLLLKRSRATNGNQTIGTETNRTSSADGPRR